MHSMMDIAGLFASFVILIIFGILALGPYLTRK